MYSIYPWKHLRTHHFASSQQKKFWGGKPHQTPPPFPGLVACTAKKASYAPEYDVKKWLMNMCQYRNNISDVCIDEDRLKID